METAEKTTKRYTIGRLEFTIAFQTLTCIIVEQRCSQTIIPQQFLYISIAVPAVRVLLENRFRRAPRSGVEEKRRSSRV